MPKFVKLRSVAIAELVHNDVDSALSMGDTLLYPYLTDIFRDGIVGYAKFTNAELCESINAVLDPMNPIDEVVDDPT